MSSLMIAVALLCHSPDPSNRGWQNKLECQKKITACLNLYINNKDGVLNERVLIRCVAEGK